MERAVLRLEIDGLWEPQDFIEVLQAVESLYYKAAVERRYRYRDLEYRSMKRPRVSGGRYERELDELNDWLLEDARRSAVDERMVVSRISYASPGGIDLVGLGRALEALERLLGRLITLVTERTLRREGDKQAQIETAVQRETLRAKQIENTREVFQLWADFPERGETLIPLADRDQERLISRILEGKLKSVRVLRGGEPVTAPAGRE